MTDLWQTLLTQQQSLTTFNSRDPRQFMPLPEVGVLQVTGDEAQQFLQNLLTNDVNALEINQSQLSGFCNAKGRLFAIFLLVRRRDCYQLIIPENMCTLLLQRLSTYILRSKVTITDTSTSTVCIGLVQTQSDTTSTVDFPSDNYQGREHNSNLLIKLPSTYPRYLTVSSTEGIDEWVQLLHKQQWQLATESAWQQLDINAGLPMIYPKSKEIFTPQQVNLDLINGVSFNKGCYPGQEIVARLYYLGKPSRRLFLAKAQTNSLAEIGNEITTNDGMVAGHIVDAQHSDENTLILLVSLKLSALEATLFINDTTLITVNSDLSD